MRIAIVNDMNLALEVLRRVVLSRPGYEVAWTASNGRQAVERCLLDTPDLILMDLIMPEVGGVEATRQIMARCPCAILVVTASVDHKADLVFQALGAGALDAVKTPAVSHPGNPLLVEPILRKIATVEKLIRPTRPVPAPRPKGLTLVALGASSGGPQALARILSALPASIPAALVVIQHIDPEFVEGLVDWLGEQTCLPVKLAEEGDRPRAGQVLVAGSQGNLMARVEGTLHYCNKPSPRLNRPSIDTLFESLAEHWPGPVVGGLLTGMGSDGALGLLALRQARHYTFAQDKHTSVIFGMPEAAIRLGAACEVVALERIAATLQGRMTLRRSD
jgi:two-component system response regulator WspF